MTWNTKLTSINLYSSFRIKYKHLRLTGPNISSQHRQTFQLEQGIHAFIRERFASVHHRQLLVLSGHEDWCMRVAQQLISLSAQESDANLALLTCNTEIAGIDVPGTTNSQYRQHLGREYDWIIYNAWQGLRANALAGLAGTVKSNGLFIILCPNFAQWQQHQDAAIDQRVSFGFADAKPKHYFIQHLVGAIKADPHCIVINGKGISGKNVLVAADLLQHRDNMEQQQAIIQKVQKVALGHRKRPLVITADRGRGKSAALGIAAAQLAADEDKQIIVTAPQKDAVFTLFKHAHLSAPNTADNIRFLAIDELVENSPSCDLLMVDEAAAIPVKLLIALTQRYARIVFTTTVNGYEGSGRGFEIRFKSWLQKHRPDTRFDTLTTPYRWYEQDCLEWFWWQTLHLKPVVNSEPSTGIAEIHFAPVSKSELLENKRKTNRIFSLLVSAHYQTTPDDFVAMLDAPEQTLLVAYGRDSNNDLQVVGVLLANLEGKITDHTLITDILKGQRRVQGHMLAQQLGLATCDPLFPCKTYLRIVRIAVDESHRQQGIGCQLLGELHTYAVKQGIDYLGSSFGANTELLSFWRKNQYCPVLLGFHKDKATAEYNLTVLKAVQNDAHWKTLRQQLSGSLKTSLLFHLSGIFHDVENELVIALLQDLLDAISASSLIAGIEMCKLTWFSTANRSLEHTAPALSALFENPLFYQKLSQSDIALLLDYVLKRKTITHIAATYQLEGQRGVLTAMKTALAKLLKEESAPPQD